MQVFWDEENSKPTPAVARPPGPTRSLDLLLESATGSEVGGSPGLMPGRSGSPRFRPKGRSGSLLPERPGPSACLVSQGFPQVSLSCAAEAHHPRPARPRTLQRFHGKGLSLFSLLPLALSLLLADRELSPATSGGENTTVPMGLSTGPPHFAQKSGEPTEIPWCRPNGSHTDPEHGGTPLVQIHTRSSNTARDQALRRSRSLQKAGYVLEVQRGLRMLTAGRRSPTRARDIAMRWSS